ncbi:acyl-CoA N-acyltransferase [Kockovaella imperatae]|uniref:Acyl-CoA N-acyltransferase n=1 Tax=Kockovaella imperatae TaxID=4999 RepID=A0A1Y1UGL0_9TREE|nr:acyl-CoA N-acyltransferase [Kockovaella imperatae]ORX37109.1 acyl-CoA N-acyltransferase [Kockovaella imperatae]
MSKIDVQILPMELSDIPTVGELTKRAFEQDAHTVFKVHEKGGQMEDELPTPAIEGWIGYGPDRCRVIKAMVDGEIKGWAAWGLYNLKGDKVLDPAEPSPEPLDAPINHPDFPADKSLPKIKQLDHLTSGHLYTMSDRLCVPPNKVVYCMSIAVEPSAQGQGVGSQLVKYAVDIADSHGASMWVHLSEDGAKTSAFTKYGFESVNELEFDLDEYREKEVPEGRDRWGKYKFTFARRPAKK